ncbi:hypothetical protein AX16_010603 [Volvariella volvacea WC 439]|nr:hypothetical protein AX16_010603 [Volvariella volvacea WC 439]
MSYETIALNEFSSVFSDTTELSSVAIGGKIIEVSDEFFAAAHHLLLVEPAPSLKGQFGPNGALFSGWESRRHNPTYDWCIIQLGTSGHIVGFDVDTSHFNGNEAPQVSVDLLDAPFSQQPPKQDDKRWVEILPKVNLGPSSRHLFRIPPSKCGNFVKLNMYPDGGIARFRVYGQVAPIIPDSAETFDLAHVFAGGHVVFTSDQHFGVGSNLILPGRGKDMGDGWETKRSRQKGHKDWAIIRLGTSGYLEYVEIDTAHFKGNFPESCEIHALAAVTELDWKETYDDQAWRLILPRTRLGPHRQHYFQLENADGVAYTHIRVTIHPDGGIKRVRVHGRRADLPDSASAFPLTMDITAESSTSEHVSSPLPDPPSTSSKPIVHIPVLPLTPEAFAPFGHVIQAYGDHTAAPKGTKITPANDGTASKFHKLALTTSSYHPETGATTGLSVYRCQPVALSSDGTVELKELERHLFTNQAFIPMGPGEGEGLRDPSARYLVVVAHNGEDDRPNVKTIRAFLASTAQGIMYKPGLWHQPMTVLDKLLDFTCVETQIGDGSAQDCEIVSLLNADASFRLRI